MSSNVNSNTEQRDRLSFPLWKNTEPRNLSSSPLVENRSIRPVILPSAVEHRTTRPVILTSGLEHRSMKPVILPSGWTPNHETCHPPLWLNTEPRDLSSSPLIEHRSMKPVPFPPDQIYLSSGVYWSTLYMAECTSSAVSLSSKDDVNNLDHDNIDQEYQGRLWGMRVLGKGGGWCEFYHPLKLF